MSSDQPLLLIVSSPSGAGKTTLTRRLFERVRGLRFSVSHTTRKPREGERDGREYHFVSRKRFDELIKRDEFLEWARVHDNLYGTSRSEIESDARGIVFDIDWQGARQVKSKLRDAVAVFILPPSMEALLERLRGRASEDEATVQRRFSVAQKEIAEHEMFDYLLVNEDVDEATERLVGIFLAEECRKNRPSELAEALAAEGHGYGGKTPPGPDTNET